MDEEQDSYEQEDQISPLQMLMGAGFSTVTAEGKQRASEIFEDLYSGRDAGFDEQQKAYDDYEVRAKEARTVLQRAREQLAAKRTPTTKWLEMAKGFGAPTRAGSFGESISNYATARIPGKQAESEWEQNRDKDVLGYDQGMNEIDQKLAMQRLAMRAARSGANDKLMVEALKISGKPTPIKAPPRDNRSRATEALDKAYVKDYVDFIQQGAANASSDIDALKAANRTLKGTTIDPKTGQEVPGPKSDTISGPLVGLLPKVLRDVILPQGSEAQEAVESVAQKSMRVIMGPQFTQKEGQDLLARVYNPRFEEKVNARRVSRLIEQLERAYAEKQRAAEYFQQNGTLDGFQGRTQWSTSMFDPNIPEGDSPLDAMSREYDAISGNAPQGDPGVDGDAHTDYEWEDGEPAVEPQQFAEGGQVRQLPNGRQVFTMPDGSTMGAPADKTYEQALERWQMLSGNAAPTRPGLPPQAIPAPGADAVRPPAPVARPQPARPPLRAAIAPPQEEDPTLMAEALGNLPYTVGGAGAGALTALGANVVVPPVFNTVTGRRETPAQKRILNMMEERKMNPQGLANQVRQTQKLGVPGMVLDEGDPFVRNLAEDALTETGGQHATDVLNRLRARQDTSSDRVMEQVNQGLKPDEYFATDEKLLQEMRTNAEPLYKAAYAAHPSVKSQEFMRLAQTKDGKAAIKAAVRIMQNKGQKIGKADITGMVRNPSLEFLDKVKQGYDQLIQQEEGAGLNKQKTPLSDSMKAARKALRDELDLITTDKSGKSLYKEARAQYEGDASVHNALEMGRNDFMALQPQEFNKIVKGMSFAERDALRTGVAQKLYELIETPTTDINAARKLVGSPLTRKKLQLLFDHPKQFEIFNAALEREMDIYDQSKSTLTKARQGQAGHVQPPPNLPQKVTKNVPRLGIGSPMMWAMQFIRNWREDSPEKVDEVLKYLKASTPEELAEFEKTLGKQADRRVSRKRRPGRAATAGAVLGAGAVAESMLDDDDAE